MGKRREKKRGGEKKRKEERRKRKEERKTEREERQPCLRAVQLWPETDGLQDEADLWLVTQTGEREALTNQRRAGSAAGGADVSSLKAVAGFFFPRASYYLKALVSRR